MVKKPTKGRPPKSPQQRREADIRIPVTTEEKKIIQSATENGELAAWAREILLAAAKNTKRP